MNIDSANLSSSLAPSSAAMVENMSPPLAGGVSVSAEGFSGALVAQIDLLSNIKTPLQPADNTALPVINGSQGVTALPAGKVDMQNIAALLGNDLPPSYQINGDVDHEAVLGAVTDTLKYIGMNATAAEKAAVAEQNIKNVIAMAVPAGQNGQQAVTTPAAVGQNLKAALATVVSAGPSRQDAATTPAAVGQNVKAALATAVSAGPGRQDAVTTPAVVGQNLKAALATAVSAKQSSQDAVITTVPEGKNLKNALAMAVQAGRNSKDAIAASVPVKENAADVIATAVPAEGNIEDALALTVSVTKQNIQDPIAAAVSVEQGGKEVAAVVVPNGQSIKDTMAMAVSPQQTPADVIAEAEQGMKNTMVSMVTAQMDSKQAKNAKPDKKQVEGEAPIAVVADNQPTEELAAAIAAAMPTEQEKNANNLSSPTMVEEDELLSFIKSSIEDAKPNQPAKASDGVLRNTTVFRQPVQDNQNLNLKSFDHIENTGAVEKAGRAEQQALNFDGEKTLPRVGADLAQPSKWGVDNKVDVPAITKPLSHPEWNKDLGERIVWMSSKAIPSAEIRLNPQHLGPISVRVDVADDQATVVFTAQHAATREAIEASIPKLREMMGTQQLNLAEVNISQGSMSDQGRSPAQNFAQTADGRGQGQSAGANAAVNGIDEIEQELESGRAVVSNGLLSIYA